MKKNYQPEIKYYSAKFIATLVIGMVCAMLPIVFLGGGAVILAMACGICGTGLSMLVFGLIRE